MPAPPPPQGSCLHDGTSRTLLDDCPAQQAPEVVLPRCKAASVPPNMQRGIVGARLPRVRHRRRRLRVDSPRARPPE
eukprot:6575166-Prymnesium_polylepis.1